MIQEFYDMLLKACSQRATGYLRIMSGLVGCNITRSRDHFAKICRAFIAQTLSKEGFSDRMIARCMGCSRSYIYLLKKENTTCIAGLAADFNKRKYDIQFESNPRAVEMGGCL
jgi:hypothetical protein